MAFCLGFNELCKYVKKPKCYNYGNYLMYVKHSNSKLPGDLTKKIWRYMNFTKFVNLIDSESLFFCRADKFHDKWEGVFPKKMIEKFGLAEGTFP